MEQYTLTTEQSDALIALLGMNPTIQFIRSIKQMEPSAAWQAIESKIPNVPYELKQAVVQLARPYTNTVLKSRMYALLWLCGASYGQIATLSGVAKSTVSSLARPLIPQSVRDNELANRPVKQPTVTLTEVVAYKQLIEEWANSSDHSKSLMIIKGNIVSIASMLMVEYAQRSAELSEDTQGDPYAALFPSA